MKFHYRKYHKWVGVAIALPLILITISGIILQFRNNLEWLQPKTIKVDFNRSQPLLSLDKIVANYDVQKIEQVIYKPNNGSLVIRFKNGVEIQKHPETGVVIRESVRRIGTIIDLHQGSIGDSIILRYLIFVPVGFGLFFLIVSGILIVVKRGGPAR